MAYLVNRQPVPEALIREEGQRLGRDPRWDSIPEEAARTRQVRAAAEQSAVGRILVEQAAANDPRPIDSRLIETEVRQVKSRASCRGAFDDTAVRQWAEKHLRIQRTTRDMVSSAAKPTAAQIEDFYNANRDNFRCPEMFHAAHIVKHVTHEQSEQQAEAGIRTALAELERGDPFAEVAERHSDCRGNGGDLGRFPAGQMVPEFDEAIRLLEPGQRTGVFTTRFGFHIAELRAKTPPPPASLDEVRADIERVMTTMNQHQAYLSAIAALRSGADIRWVPDVNTVAC
jgi:parvulin-like peptidyl-prolyl isomerase